MKICLDPGHQAKDVDTGAQGNGLREELLTLDICQRLKSLLEFNGFDVVMTREGDFVNGPHNTVNESLQTRYNIANKAQANLFISVHVNAGNGTGTEIYICGRGGQAEKLANIARYYLVQQCAWKDRGVKVSGFQVLVNTAMPAILTENGFIDNLADASLLGAEDFRQKIAVAHAKAVCDYYGQEYQEKGATTIQAQSPSDLEFVPPTGDNIFKLPGIGWIETLADRKRVILHLGRSTYISLEDGSISLYARGKERRVLI